VKGLMDGDHCPHEWLITMEIRVTYRIRTKDPEVLCWNPVIGVLESQSELIRAAGECEYILSDIRGHRFPFGSK
jgi:hypothetical protein